MMLPPRFKRTPKMKSLTLPTTISLNMSVIADSKENLTQNRMMDFDL